MRLRFASKTVIFSFTIVLTFVFVTAFLLPTVCVAGKGKEKKGQGMDKVEMCHITGSYDFGEGDVPVGHVIKIAESAYDAHLKQGDCGYFDVVDLPDGSKVCFEPAAVCHFDETTYDFGDGEGEVPIGKVIKIPAAYYQAHIGHGDPETYKNVTLPEPSGEEVCLERLDGQFDKGMALFGHDYDDGDMLTRYLRPDSTTQKVFMSQVLNNTKRGAHWRPITSFYIDGKQYIMGMRSYKNDAGKYPYFIQQILPSGDFGPNTAGGAYNFYYKTLIAMTLADGKVFIFGQEDGNNNHAMTQEILPGGTLDSQPWHDDWDTFFDTVTPIPFANGRTCFYAHDSHHDNKWEINCLHQPGVGTEGSVYRQDHGTHKVGYQVALSYREGGQTYLFRHRHHLESGHEKGPWRINKINSDYKLVDETDGGTWDKYYQTMTTFFHLNTGYQYIFGHNSDKDWFIRHVLSSGLMWSVIDSGKWDVNYEYACPVAFDKDTYWGVGDWMGDINDIIGERKLTEIALPGSHDSGMNKDDTGECSAGGHNCNTVTQTWNIQGQLALGSRFFDIRPMVDVDEDGSQNWTTGHGARVGTDITAGCRGEARDSIILSLRDFFDNPDHANELVILKVSNCMQPPGNGYGLCTDVQNNNVAHDLAWRLNDYLVKCYDNCDLKEETLNDLLNRGYIRGNIILTVDADSHKSQGIFKWGTDYFNHDKFSNTNNFHTMVYGGTNNDGDPDDGQISKLYNYGNDWQFLLSWTLTLSKENAGLCWDGGTSIMKKAFITEPRIFEYMYKEFEAGNLTKKYFPNILYVDDFGRTATSAAIYLNRNWDSLVDDR